MSTESTADTKHATGEAIGMKFTAHDEAHQHMADALNADLDEYLGHFAFDDNKCPGCDRKLSGIFGSFQYGLAWGEGRCCECGWPCRSHHEPKDRNGEAIFTTPVQIVLAYHPEFVTTRPRDENEDGETT